MEAWLPHNTSLDWSITNTEDRARYIRIVTCCLHVHGNGNYTVHKCVHMCVLALTFVSQNYWGERAGGIIAQEEATVQCLLEAIVSNDPPGSCCYRQPPSLPASEWLLIDQLIQELLRLDSLSKAKKTAGLGRSKHRHIAPFEDFVQKIGIPGFSLFVGEDSNV